MPRVLHLVSRFRPTGTPEETVPPTIPVSRAARAAADAERSLAAARADATAAQSAAATFARAAAERDAAAAAAQMEALRVRAGAGATRVEAVRRIVGELDAATDAPGTSPRG